MEYYLEFAKKYIFSNGIANTSCCSLTGIKEQQKLPSCLPFHFQTYQLFSNVCRKERNWEGCIILLMRTNEDHPAKEKTKRNEINISQDC